MPAGFLLVVVVDQLDRYKVLTVFERMEIHIEYVIRGRNY